MQFTEEITGYIYPMSLEQYNELEEKYKEFIVNACITPIYEIFGDNH